jgi:hypothetical protein
MSAQVESAEPSAAESEEEVADAPADRATPRAPTDLDTRPSRFGGSLALLVGFVGLLALVLVPLAALVGAVGLLALVLGVRRGTRAAVTGGAAGLFVGVLIAGVFGAPSELLLLATAATVVSWDVAENAVGLGNQLGREADTARAELVHAAASVALAVSAATVGYLGFRFGGTGNPITALVLLLVGAVVLISVFRR